MILKRSEYPTHADFVYEVSDYNEDVGNSLTYAIPFTCDVCARIRVSKLNVEFDCSIAQLVDLVDVEIVDIVYDTKLNELVFEVGR